MYAKSKHHLRWQAEGKILFEKVSQAFISIELGEEQLKYEMKTERSQNMNEQQMQQLKDSVMKSGADVKGFGMQINDNGTASYFAVLKKSSADQKARIEKKAEQKKEEKKIADKKAQKKAEEKRLEKSHSKDVSKIDTNYNISSQFKPKDKYSLYLVKNLAKNY